MLKPILRIVINGKCDNIKDVNKIFVDRFTDYHTFIDHNPFADDDSTKFYVINGTLWNDIKMFFNCKK